MGMVAYCLWLPSKYRDRTRNNKKSFGKIINLIVGLQLVAICKQEMTYDQIWRLVDTIY